LIDIDVGLERFAEGAEVGDDPVAAGVPLVFVVDAGVVERCVQRDA